MLKVNTLPKAHESRFPTIRLPNGNVVKFSHTNRKHLTVCELMAFHSVKMGIKTPKPPSPCTTWTPSVAGPRAWNTLPDAIRRCSSPDTFKRSLKTHLYIQSYF